MNRYAWNGINTGTLPSHCERIACYWATLKGFAVGASSRASSMRYKAVRAFKAGLSARGLPDKQVEQAYVDTLELARLKMSTMDSQE